MAMALESIHTLVVTSVLLKSVGVKRSVDVSARFIVNVNVIFIKTLT